MICSHAGNLRPCFVYIYIQAIPYVAHLTKEASFMAVAQAISIRLLISLIPEKLLNTIDM